jgi:hypothetical protein
VTAQPSAKTSGLPRLERASDGKLRFDPRDGSEPAADVRVHRAWPLRWHDRYITILDHEGHEIRMFHSIDELDAACHELVRSELAERYFTTRIRAVLSVRPEHVVSYWEVETDRGRREFVIEESEHNPRRIAEATWLFEDVSGNRFLIDDVRVLDARSRKLLSRLVE